MPKRTFQKGQPESESKDPSETPKIDRDAETLASLELSTGNVDDIDTNEGDGDDLRTVFLVSDQTVDFTQDINASDIDSNDIDAEQSLEMVTSQWEDNVEGSQTDPNLTIKQKETVAGPFVSRSSLVVKSRHVRPPHQTEKPSPSPADAPDYELLNVIGEGGMGVVYAAKQSSIARTVAVKMLKGQDASTADQREKFISEAVVTGELEHPNIVPVYDLGSNEEGALFYSMKRVRGTPWNDVLSDKSLDENLNILLRVADAVAFAHANGVIHRDLKPENVMLGDFGEVLVMDWGLARISADFPNADSVSQSDVMGGTPAYMAPEMAAGPIDSITTASDVYLLGAILFEIVTDRPPHKGKSVMDCLRAVSQNKIIDTGHSGELVDISRRAMATRPEDRHAGVQAFQESVRQYQSHSESIVLTGSASQSLERASEQDDYDLFARAVYGFQEAISLWEGNRQAEQMLSTARVVYAQNALGKGDLDLGISLLDAEDERHAEALDQLLAARRERQSRQRRLRLLKGVVAALLCTVAGIVTVSYYAVRSQRNEARSQRDRAVVAEADATQNYNAAEAARKVAETEKQRAESERERAEREKERAEQQRQLAIEAKQSEQYEAYVARIGLTKAKIDENSFDRALELLDELHGESRNESEPDLRHWEWGRLAHLCRLSHRNWRLDGPVDAVAFAPDGQHFASGDWDGKARLWKIDSDKPEHVFEHGEYVHAVAYDGEGIRLATGSSDHTVRIYGCQDGKLLQTLVGHTDAVLSVQFSPDGQWLVSSGYDNTARLWDLESEGDQESGKCEQVLRGHNWWVWSAQFSPDGEQIVTAGQDGKAIVWKRSKAEQQFEIQTEFSQHRGPVYVARFSPDGKVIATGGYDRRVLLWNPDRVESVDVARRVDELPDPPAPYRELLGHSAPVRAIAFSPLKNMMISGGQDNVLHVWNLSSGKLKTTLRGHASHVRSCDFSPDGRWLLSAGRDQQIKLWEPDQYAESITLGSAGLGNVGLGDAALGDDTVVGHSDAVLDARFSRDGKQIVTASRDRTAALWDVATGKMMQRFEEGHQFLASSAKFFPGGSRLVTGAGDGTTRIWDVATATEVMQLAATGRTAALDVADNGRWIVTGGSDGSAIVWDAQTGDRTALLGGHESDVTAAKFAPGSHLLATGDDRGRCRLWKHDPASGQWMGGYWLRGHSRTITALAFVDGASVEGGRRLVTASGDNTCGQWDVATGRELTNSVLRHPDWVTDMDVSDDGRMALTCSDDGVLRIWSLEDAPLGNAQLLRKIAPPRDGVFTSVDLSADGRFALAASAANRTVRMWNLDTGKEIVAPDQVASDQVVSDQEEPQKAWLDFQGRGGQVWSAQFTPDGRHVLTIGGNDARLWDRESRAAVARFSPHGAVSSADISPDGRLLVTGSWDQSAKIWDIESGQAIRKLSGLHHGYINSVQFSPPDGNTILTASDDGTARLWDVASGKPLQPVFEGHNSRVRQSRFDALGKRVLLACNDKTARICDAASGEVELQLTGHLWAVLCGEFSLDGERAITGSEDNTAMVWNAETGERLVTLAGHTGSITAVAFSPDRRRVLTGCEDSTVKLWDAETGKEILTLAGHRGGVTSVSFSPDGRSVLSSGRDGKTILWPAAQWNTAGEREE